MKKKYLVIFSFVILLLAIPISVFLIKQRQEIRKEAAVSGGTAKFSLSGPTTVAVGETLPITINILGDTTDDKGIIGIKATLEYSFTGENPLGITEADIETKLKEMDDHWNYYLKQVNVAGNTVTIVIEAVYLQVGETGYTGAETQEQPFATLNFTTKKSAEVTFNLVDQTRSEVRAKEQNLDVLDIDLANISVAVTEGGIPAPTATATPPVQAPTATPTLTQPAATATPTTTPGAGGNQPTITATLPPGQQPTATPMIAPVKLTNFSSGQMFTTNRPTFSGTAAPGAEISITIESEVIQGQTIADDQGDWSWSPNEDIPPGQHKVTIIATDNQGNASTLTDTFTISEAGAPSATPTSITSQPELPETATSIPTIIISIAGTLLLLLGLTI